MPAVRLLASLLLLVPLVGALAVPVDAAPATVTVPSVGGLRVEQAEKRMLHLGLSVRLIGPAEGTGARFVQAQWPSAGTRVRQGVQVRLTYRWVGDGAAPPGSRRSKTVRAPSVLGLTPDAAIHRLQNAGLGGRVFGVPPKNGKVRVVAAQYPAAGTTVRRGVVVRLTVRYRN